MRKLIFGIAIIICIIVIVLFFKNLNNDNKNLNNNTNTIGNEHISQIKEEKNKVYVYTAKSPDVHKEIDNESIQNILSIINDLNFEEGTVDNYMKTYYFSFENGNVYSLVPEEKIIIKNDNEIAKVNDDKFEILLNMGQKAMAEKE